MILETASTSHPGLVRLENEDALGSRIPDEADVRTTKGALFGVADGLGGHAAGEVASRTAIDTVIEEYYSLRAPSRIEQALRQAMQAANVRVFQLAHGATTTRSWRGMQTTLTVLTLAGRQAYLAHVGDSRAYLLRDGALTQLTGDHSEAADLLRLRLITPDEARDHPRRSVLTRTVGSTLLLRPDFSRLPVQAGDCFLLCTDGLWGALDHETLRRALGQSLVGACDELVALACQQGGADNMSVHLVRVIELGPAPPPASPGRLARLLAGLRGG